MLHSWTLSDIKTHQAWLTIGSFDGVHRGHQEIIRKITQRSHANRSPSVVLTFFPHPADILGKRKNSFYLSSPEEKIQIMSSLGVDYLITHPFNRWVASLSAYDFIYQLKQNIDFSHLVVGSNFALGRNREGDLEKLTDLGKDLNFSVHPIEPLMLNGRVISSSWVRDALMQGDMEEIEGLLGRPFSLQGEVIRGDQRGKTLGFPTANLEIWEKRALPKNGVYAGFARVSGDKTPAVINIGYRPTFKENLEHPRVEVHIINFNKEIYGCKLEVSFSHLLREEKRFESPEALIDQISIDVQTACEILEVKCDEAVP